MTRHPRQPVLFFGHGNPMNAIVRNPYAQRWEAIGRSLAKPKAVLCVSAHWYVDRVAVTASAAPRTIHDFGGFPRELYAVRYPAPGDPELCERVAELLGDVARVQFDDAWGLDHGAWSVLMHLFPDADVPVVQLSIDETQPARFHYEVGQRLSALRDEDILLVGSGNVVHNLHAFAWGGHPARPFEWAARFEARVRELAVAGDFSPLIAYESLGSDAQLSVPTPDHFLPLLYMLGARGDGDVAAFPVEGIDGGSVSMLAVQLENAA